MKKKISLCVSIFQFIGCEIVPNGFPGRLIFITFWTMCVVTHSSFTAVLTTHLTTARYEPLSSLEEALDEGFKISVLRGTQQYQKIIGVRVFYFT